LNAHWAARRVREAVVLLWARGAGLFDISEFEYTRTGVRVGRALEFRYWKWNTRCGCLQRPPQRRPVQAEHVADLTRRFFHHKGGAAPLGVALLA